MDNSSPFAPFPWEHDGETISFDTPEQTRIEFKVAAFGTRITAAFLDVLLVWAVLVVIWLTVFFSLFALGDVDSQTFGYLAAGGLVLHFLFNLFYFVWAELRGEGQTWGKRRCGIRTIMLTGHPLTFGASLVRNLARIVDHIPIFWIIAAFTKGHRRLGDLIAGTIVVVVARERQASSIKWLAASYAELEDRQFFFTSEHSEKLFSDDLNLLEHLEERVATLHVTRRREVIAEVAEKYARRLEMDDELERVADDPRRFLKELALFVRDKFEGQAY